MSSYTDTKKLETRIDTHKKYSTYDIHEWILEKVSLKNGEKLLDIGCGTGEQLLRFAKKYPNSKIIGLDVAEKSLKIIEEECSKNNIRNIEMILGEMDDLPTLLGSTNSFDVVNSCFAMYYSKNIDKLISNITDILKPNGRLFICGPIPGNNAELIKFQEEISNFVSKELRFVMTEVILPVVLKKFGNVTEYHFNNPIKFPNAAALIDYWKAYPLFDSFAEEVFANSAKKFFEQNSQFVTTKRVLGILAKM